MRRSTVLLGLADTHVCFCAMDLIHYIPVYSAGRRMARNVSPLGHISPNSRVDRRCRILVITERVSRKYFSDVVAAL
jgi:hypothetical protein